MKGMSFGSIPIIALFIASEMIINTTANKPVQLPDGIVVPAAVFIYALTFTLIDLVNERFGKQGARYVVYSAFIANLLLAGYMLFGSRSISQTTIRTLWTKVIGGWIWLSA